MTQEIEPGDLTRDPEGHVSVADHMAYYLEPRQLIAKGPGWTRHDGSSVNPVPGAMVEVMSRIHEAARPGPALPSDDELWSGIAFYRVTTPAPSHPPAPQPGWVATVTLEWVKAYPGTPDLIKVKWPNGDVSSVVGGPGGRLEGLDWQPPPPPPWEPTIGEPAKWSWQIVTVRGIHEDDVWIETHKNLHYTVNREDLSRPTPPKGGEA